MTARKRPAKKPAKRQPSVWVVEVYVAKAWWPESYACANRTHAESIRESFKALQTRVAEYRRVERKRR